MSHALLAPSSASRWLTCTPSARFEAQFADKSSRYADEGSLCHKYAEHLLRYGNGEINMKELKALEKEIAENELYASEMSEHAWNYADYVMRTYGEARETNKDALLKIEAHLDLSEYVPESHGTADAVIIADNYMDVIDLKYGKGVPVSSVENKQMMAYALGAFSEFGYLYGITTIRLHVYQPRIENISTWDISLNGLLEWGEAELKPKAQIAFEGGGDFAPGEHCRFCKAKIRCRALADMAQEVAKHDFKKPDTLDDDEISEILTSASLLEDWVNTIKEYALDEAIRGKTWKGFKLVEGRSKRIYADTAKVAKTLIDNGANENEIYKKELIGITAMATLLGKKGFAQIVEPLLIKPAGKPTLVPLSDKRAPLNGTDAAKQDFNGVNVND